jgi:hypothetical protein
LPSSGLTLHKIPLNNGKRNSEFLKFPRLNFFFESIYIDESLQKKHFFGTKLHELMQGHQENNGSHWNFLENYPYKMSSWKNGGIMCGAKEGQFWVDLRTICGHCL